MSTRNITACPTVEDGGDEGETSVYQKFGSPEEVVQLGFPVVLLIKVIEGLRLRGSVTL